MGRDCSSEELTAYDIAVGFVAGTLPEGPWPRSATDPVRALAAAVRPGLERQPCVIGFSGGRDSSLLLAVAVREARRAGLPLPIPVTLEFDSERSREREWQELVILHLGLEDWVRLPQTDELDLLGPVAMDGLRRHGVMYPGNAHMIVPLARVASGGSVVLGAGGDEVLGAWPFQDLAAALAGRRPARLRDLRRTAACAAPARLRAARYAQGVRWVQMPWLRPPFREEAARHVARDMAGAPRTWSERMRWHARRRLWAISDEASRRHAAEHDVLVVGPLLDHGLLAALGTSGGRLGLGDRSAVTRILVDGTLPESLVERETKAEFSEAYFGVHTKRFAGEWDGRTGIDSAIVDPDALRAEWLSDHPHSCSAALLQSAWLASQTADTAAGRSPASARQT
jgi:asparagine synthase (glutamine-hydrolysing)